MPAARPNTTELPNVADLLEYDRIPASAAMSRF